MLYTLRFNYIGEDAADYLFERDWDEERENVFTKNATHDVYIGTLKCLTEMYSDDMELDEDTNYVKTTVMV